MVSKRIANPKQFFKFWAQIYSFFGIYLLESIPTFWNLLLESIPTFWNLGPLFGINTQFLEFWNQYPFLDSIPIFGFYPDLFEISLTFGTDFHFLEQISTFCNMYPLFGTHFNLISNPLTWLSIPGARIASTDNPCQVPAAPDLHVEGPTRVPLAGVLAPIGVPGGGGEGHQREKAQIFM